MLSWGRRGGSRGKALTMVKKKKKKDTLSNIVIFFLEIKCFLKASKNSGNSCFKARNLSCLYRDLVILWHKGELF